ncbi:hypothetical protein M409DRAFT_27150 [Zasmidium cellare ATCC 36951]|uniref:Secreted protein n=1 Tax=Zasmidium cellare ATCC 36951 TaxID=1080233 RepID=A0A6A6C5S9_ZASCE|nr:uncharacterized protein M409DRAFT_27150 [Zasmidium cellare ATCC 36951]KAF2162527.1 hypothetical protein M409DRAFT_27150 [Zasmidium cellare ATCC 36951]
MHHHATLLLLLLTLLLTLTTAQTPTPTTLLKRSGVLPKVHLDLHPTGTNEVGQTTFCTTQTLGRKPTQVCFGWVAPPWNTIES